MSAYRDAEPRASLVMRVGLRGWRVLLVGSLASTILAFRGGYLLTSLALFCLAWAFAWTRAKTIVVDREERVIEVEGRRFRVAEVVGVSARSQLELVISVEGGEDIVLVPAGLTDARVACRARELRDALDELR